jgi:hypothetical protein
VFDPSRTASSPTVPLSQSSRIVCLHAQERRQMTEGTGLDRPVFTAIEQCSAYLEELHARIAHHFQ